MFETELKIFAIIVLFVLLLYVFFVSNNLESTFDQNLANNSDVGQEGFKGESKNNSIRNVKGVVENVQSLVDALDDDLRVNKYRKEYEEVVTNAEELFELCRVSQLTNLKDISSKDLDKVSDIAKVITDLGGSIESLDGCRNYIDGK